MKFGKHLLCLSALVLAGCATGSQSAKATPALVKPDSMTLAGGWTMQDIAKVNGTPEQISQPGYQPGGWYQATVPGTVLTTLVNQGVYPEPLYGENNRPDRIPESLARQKYWYRTTFDVPAIKAGRKVWLNFDGINYFADVWVNGHKVGEMKGAFVRGSFDVTPYVTPGEKAAVAVLIYPTLTPGDPQEQTQALGTGRNGGVLAQDGPTFIASIGWDWMPAIRDRNIGIWQKVWIGQSGPALIENPLVVSDLPLPKIDSADLTVSATVRNTTDQPVSGVLAGTIGDIKFEKNVDLKANQSSLVTFTPKDAPNLHVINPKLWWPNTYGPPTLHTLALSFTSGGAVSDRHSINFGIREFSYKVPESENLTISVNGVPIICKGGNWGIDEAMKRSPRDRLEAQIRLHQQANYTMIRNWVGQSTQEDVYDLCDRYGLLMWDEFFQPNPSDGPNPVDAELYIANVREKVLRFRHHACVALWCGRNEGDPPPHINDGIQKIMDEFEPARLYQHNSNDGRGVRSGGPYYWRPPVSYYGFNAAETFKTELGCVSIPTLQAIQNMMPEKDWNTFNDDWATHDLLRGAQQARNTPYWEVMAERYGKFTNLDGFVRNAQLANYESYRAMYEGRFAKLFKPVTGVLTWMSNPAQPSMVWQIYSHDLEPNAALFGTRKGCEPLHVQMNQNDFHVMVVNSLPDAKSNLRVRLRVFNQDASLKLEKELPVATAIGSSATDLGVIDWPAGLSTVHFVKLELFDASNKLITDNFYWRTLKILSPTSAPAPPPPTTATTRPRQQQPTPPREDFTDLNSLPMVNIDCKTARHDANGNCNLTATITNRGNAVALLVHLQLRKGNSKDRVLPVYYSDNYISLLPGESREVQIEASQKDLDGQQPTIAIDGWNVAQK